MFRHWRRRRISGWWNSRLGALQSLANNPACHKRDTYFYTLRAALSLSVGQVRSALEDIEKAHALMADNGSAFALQSIISLVQNDKESAMERAQEAARVDPNSPTPKIALSYAYQAAFDIETARDSLKKALELSPDDPLAWARLAELDLSLGELDEALDAAQKAEALDPGLSRTQMVLGFAYLTQIDVDEAMKAFNKAIELDPAAPLPRLGLGLAKIRRGDVEAGTKEIEVAAILDPGNSLVRSYLGKAYYEEKRGNVASREFERAKQLDPKDPTPWFYDAIHKQTVNRPVEALHDMQKAIELNDNRAVYRSRLLLDDDLAARSAALGRIYNDLGFQQRGLLEGWKSVNTDPSNYSAHRLLADNYAALPRHEIARVSELLQSQLLQPLNVTPVQPQLAESNLLVLDGLGPANASFNEFNPLFARNRFALQISGVAGSNDTQGDEITQSGVWNKFSYSLGQLHFDTEGFRKNNDLERDIYTAFAQYPLSPDTSIQAEYRFSELANGDRRVKFDPEEFVNGLHESLRTHSTRFGLNHKFNPRETLIASIFFTDQDFKSRDVREFSTERRGLDTETLSGEVQYFLHQNRLDITAGFGYSKQNSSIATSLFFPPDPPDFPDADLFVQDTDFDSAHANTYGYSNLRVTDNITATLGLSSDFLNHHALKDRHTLNPKFGLMWELSDKTIFRVAAFRTLKRQFASNQTIEPTQVAGFNQFFDDNDGTKSERYALALDHIFAPSVFAGIEISGRQLKVPIFNEIIGRGFFTEDEEQSEQLYRSYLYWAPNDQIAITAEYRFEKFDRNLTTRSDLALPADTYSHVLPLAFNFFSKTGFFAKFKASYVEQKVIARLGGTAGGSDRFWIVDTDIGYRLPNRWGIFTVGIKNIFDENFQFHETGFQTGIARRSLFQRERFISGGFTINF